MFIHPQNNSTADLVPSLRTLNFKRVFFSFVILLVVLHKCVFVYFSKKKSEAMDIQVFNNFSHAECLADLVRDKIHAASEPIEQLSASTQVRGSTRPS